MDDLKLLRELQESSITPSGDELRKQRERLVNEIAGAALRSRPLAGLRKRSGRSTWLVPALAGALTMAVLVVVVGFIASQPEDQVTLSQPEPDQWLYSSTVTRVTTGGKTEAEFSTESWLRADFQASAGRGDDGEVAPEPVPPAIAEYFTDSADLYGFYRHIIDDPESTVGTINDRLDNLEPALKPSMRYQARIDLVRVVLQYGAPPSEIQEVLFNAFRRLPHVDDDGIVQDEVGRESRALGAPHVDPFTDELLSESRQQLLFNPEGTAFHGFRELGTPRSASIAVVSTGVVDQTAQTP